MWTELKCQSRIVELMDCNIYFFWCYRDGEKGDWGPAGKELLTKKQRKRNSDKKRDILIVDKETWKRNHTKISIMSHIGYSILNFIISHWNISTKIVFFLLLKDTWKNDKDIAFFWNRDKNLQEKLVWALCECLKTSFSLMSYVAACPQLI